jgi:hypothetical protein
MVLREMALTRRTRIHDMPLVRTTILAMTLIRTMVFAVTLLSRPLSLYIAIDLYSNSLQGYFISLPDPLTEIDQAAEIQSDLDVREHLQVNIPDQCSLK